MTNLKPHCLYRIGRLGQAVECVSFPEPETGRVFCRMVPGDATSARWIPGAALEEFEGPGVFDKHCDELQALCEDVAAGRGIVAPKTTTEHMDSLACLTPGEAS